MSVLLRFFAVGNIRQAVGQVAWGDNLLSQEPDHTRGVIWQTSLDVEEVEEAAVEAHQAEVRLQEEVGLQEGELLLLKDEVLQRKAEDLLQAEEISEEEVVVAEGASAEGHRQSSPMW
jgi:hypothetical protein